MSQNEDTNPNITTTSPKARISLEPEVSPPDFSSVLRNFKCVLFHDPVG